jgi:site-specific recombinase XerC
MRFLEFFATNICNPHTRHLFDWLVTGQVVPVNPAASVRGPGTSSRPGKRRCSIRLRRARC